MQCNFIQFGFLYNVGPNFDSGTRMIEHDPPDIFQLCLLFFTPNKVSGSEMGAVCVQIPINTFINLVKSEFIFITCNSGIISSL